MLDGVLQLLAARQGHFLLESGHHGDLWLDLEQLCLRPRLAQRLAAEREVRTALFGRFLDEAAKLYSDALQNKRDDISGLIGIYALTNRIRLISSAQVVEAADTVCRIIIDAYLSPNITMQEMRANWIEKHVDPLRDFSEACRKELLRPF